MACRQFEELILRDLDGEMTQQERSGLVGHLGSCDDCKRERELYARVDDTIRKLVTPLPSRRDFAAIAVEKAQAALASAPRRVRHRISDTVWMTLGLAGVGVIILTIGITVWLAKRADSEPSMKVRKMARNSRQHEPLVEPQPVERPKAEPAVHALTPRELKDIFPFGEADPVRVMVDVNLGLAQTESDEMRLTLLERGAAALLDGFAEAVAYGDAETAGEYAAGLNSLLIDGLSLLLEHLRAPELQGYLNALGDRFSDRANRLMKFSQELPFDRREEMSRVGGYCSAVRDAARKAVRQP